MLLCHQKELQMTQLKSFFAVAFFPIFSVFHPYHWALFHFQSFYFICIHEKMCGNIQEYKTGNITSHKT